MPKLPAHLLRPGASRSLVADTLFGLVEDLQVAAWLLPADDDLRAYLELLVTLPMDPDAWSEVGRAWRDVMHLHADPEASDPSRLAAAGAVAAATARAARQLPETHEHLAVELRIVARACSPRVRRTVG